MENTPRRAAWPLMVLLAGMLVGSTATAQDDPEYVPDEDILATQGKDDGWDFILSIGATGNVSQNDSVIGQPDGTSITLGSKINFGADYISKSHEVRNRLNLSNTFTQTPVVPEFVRTSDTLELESIYYYHFESVPWLGPFVRLNLETSIFVGEDVRAENARYIIREADGGTRDVVDARLRLTDPFQPMRLKQSVGLFARPLDYKWLGVEFRLGVGAREILAEGGLAINDNPDTTEIEVDELSDSFQAGGEAVATIGGALFGKRVTYKAGAEALIPFVSETDADQDKSITELTNIEVFAQVSFKLVEWASLDYEFRALRQPVLLDEFQIQNNLLLTFGYTLLGEDE